MKNKKFRVSILLYDKTVFGENFNTRKQCDDYILNQNNTKLACIYNKETKEKETIRFDK